MSEPHEPGHAVSRPRRDDINGTQFTATLTTGLELRALPDGKPMLRTRVVINGKPADPTAPPKQIKLAVLYYGERAEELCRRHVSAGAWIGVTGRLDYQEWPGPNGTTRSELRVVAYLITVIDPTSNTTVRYEGADPPDAAPRRTPTTPTNPAAPPPAAAIPPPPAMPPPAAVEPADELTATVLAEFGIQQ